MFGYSLLIGLCGGIILYVLWNLLFSRFLPIEDKMVIRLFVLIPYFVGGLICGPLFTFAINNEIVGLAVAGGIITLLVLIGTSIAGLYFMSTSSGKCIC